MRQIVHAVEVFLIKLNLKRHEDRTILYEYIIDYRWESQISADIFEHIISRLFIIFFMIPTIFLFIVKNWKTSSVL